MPSFVVSSFVAFALFASSTLAHMDISQPTPLRHKANPNYASGAAANLIDYSMTSPLAPDGSNFPCKGYLVDIYGPNPVSKSVATLKAGENFGVTFEGSATHGGGSCQISLSYDQGKTFGVIYEVVGGCPLTPGLNFTVPAGAPSGDAVLAWTWFNLIGNREMYMNCAQVTVDGAGADASLSVSKMMEANVFGGPCQTIEQQNLDFANPVLTNCSNPITSADKVTLTANGSSSGGSSPASSSSSSAPASSSTETSTAPPTSTDSSTDSSTETSTTTTSTTDAPEPTETDEPCPGEDDPTDTDSTDVPSSTDPVSSSTPTASAPASTSTGSSSSSGGACTDGTIQCSADGKTWSVCDHGAYTAMGAVADGTICSNGAMNFSPEYLAMKPAGVTKRAYGYPISRREVEERRLAEIARNSTAKRRHAARMASLSSKVEMSKRRLEADH